VYCNLRHIYEIIVITRTRHIWKASSFEIALQENYQLGF